MRTLLKAACVASLFAAAPYCVAAQAIDPETIATLSEQVDALREQLGSSATLIESNRQKVTDNEYIIQNGPEVTEQMIADLNAMADSFDTDSEYYNTIQQARADIGTRIDRYRASTSEVQLQAAEALVERLTEFDAINDRRDDLVGRALAAARGLSINKDDLEALIIVEAYGQLSKVFTEMLDSFEASVEGAEGMNAALNKAAGIDPE